MNLENVDGGKHGKVKSSCATVDFALSSASELCNPPLHKFLPPLLQVPSINSVEITEVCTQDEVERVVAEREAENSSISSYPLAQEAVETNSDERIAKAKEITNQKQAHANSNQSECSAVEYKVNEKNLREQSSANIDKSLPLTLSLLRSDIEHSARILNKEKETGFRAAHPKNGTSFLDNTSTAWNRTHTFVEDSTTRSTELEAKTDRDCVTPKTNHEWTYADSKSHVKSKNTIIEKKIESEPGCEDEGFTKENTIDSELKDNEHENMERNKETYMAVDHLSDNSKTYRTLSTKIKTMFRYFKPEGLGIVSDVEKNSYPQIEPTRTGANTKTNDIVKKFTHRNNKIVAGRDQEEVKVDFDNINKETDTDNLQHGTTVGVTRPSADADIDGGGSIAADTHPNRNPGTLVGAIENQSSKEDMDDIHCVSTNHVENTYCSVNKNNGDGNGNGSSNSNSNSNSNSVGSQFRLMSKKRRKKWGENSIKSPDIRVTIGGKHVDITQEKLKNELKEFLMSRGVLLPDEYNLKSSENASKMPKTRIKTHVKGQELEITSSVKPYRNRNKSKRSNIALLRICDDDSAVTKNIIDTGSKRIRRKPKFFTYENEMSDAPLKHDLSSTLKENPRSGRQRIGRKESTSESKQTEDSKTRTGSGSGSTSCSSKKRQINDSSETKMAKRKRTNVAEVSVVRTNVEGIKRQIVISEDVETGFLSTIPTHCPYGYPLDNVEVFDVTKIVNDESMESLHDRLKHHKDISDLLGEETDDESWVKTADSNNSVLFRDIERQLTRSLCIYRNIGDENQNPWIYHANLVEAITCYEDLVKSHIIDFSRYFHSGIDALPANLLPYYDFWDSLHNKNKWNLTEFEDFVSRYLFSLKDASVPTPEHPKEFFKIFQKKRNRSVLKLDAFVEEVFRKISFGHLKTEQMLQDPIVKRLPDEVVERITQCGKLIKQKSTQEMIEDKVRLKFEYAVRKEYPESEYPLLRRYTGKFDLNIVIAVEVGKPMVGKERIREKAYVPVKKAVALGKLDAVIRNWGLKVFFQGEFAAVRKRAYETGIKLDTSTPFVHRKVSLQGGAKLFSLAIKKYRGQLDRKIEVNVYDNKTYSVTDCSTGKRYNGFLEAIQGGVFDSVLSQLNKDQLAKTFRHPILRRLGLQGTGISYRYKSAKVVLKGKFLENDSKENNIATFRELLRSLCPYLEFHTNDGTDSAPDCDNSFTMINIETGKVFNQSELSEIIDNGLLDPLLTVTGTAYLGGIPNLVKYGNERLSYLKLRSKANGCDCDLYRQKTTEELSVEGSYPKMIVEQASLICQRINEFVPMGDPSDAFYIMGKFAEGMSLTLDNVKQQEKIPLHRRYKILPYDVILKDRLFGKELLKEAENMVKNPDIFKQVVRFAYLLKLGKKMKLHTSVFTGAGIGTGEGANLPTVRGVTKAQKQDNFDPSLLEQIRPTASHMVIKALMDENYVSFVWSQNIESLHRTSGIPKTKLWEVHGNLFDFECSNCGVVYDEENPIPVADMLCSVCSKMSHKANCKDSKTLKDIHNTTRKFTRHSGNLRRRVIRHYGENVVPPDHARINLIKTQISIVIGSSLQVGNMHAVVCPENVTRRPLLVVINRGPTKHKVDNWASKVGLRLDIECDIVLTAVAKLLQLTVPDAPQVNRQLLHERGETAIDLRRIFFGERKIQ